MGEMMFYMHSANKQREMTADTTWYKNMGLEQRLTLNTTKLFNEHLD